MCGLHPSPCLDLAGPRRRGWPWAQWGSQPGTLPGRETHSTEQQKEGKGCFWVLSRGWGGQLWTPPRHLAVVRGRSRGQGWGLGQPPGPDGPCRRQRFMDQSFW